MFFHFKNEPIKNRSGAKERFFGFLAIAIATAFFVFPSDTQAYNIKNPIPYTYNDITYTNVICYDTATQNHCWYTQEETVKFYKNGANTISIISTSFPFHYLHTYGSIGNWTTNTQATSAYGINAFDYSLVIDGSLVSSLDIYTDDTFATVFLEKNYVTQISENANIILTFLYPKMLAPVYHADIQMPLLTTHVSTKVNVSFENLSDSDKQHFYITIFKMTDDSYNTVDSVNPYTETFNIASISELGNIDFLAPLLGGETEYFSIVIAPDETYANAYPDYPSFFKYNFSLTGLVPTDPNYITGQSPFIQPDSSQSSGSVFGDFLAGVGRYMFIPNPTLIDEILGTQWTLFQTQFAPIFALYKYDENAPTNAANLKIYDGLITMSGRSFGFVYDPFHTLDIPPIVPYFMTFFVYFSLIFWLIRKISDLFPE